VLDALHDRVHSALEEGDLLVERGDELAGLIQGQVQAVGQLGFAHAVHQPQADGLGGLALDAGQVGDHLVEVRVRIFPICVGHLLGPGQVQQCGIVNQ